MKEKQKINKLFVYIPIILGGLLIFTSVWDSYHKNNIVGIICGIILIIIPYVYTVLPIVKERYKENNSLLNRMSENTFTDRKKDLQNLLDLLNDNQIVQLTGYDSQCGKSWLAFKLIDYVKHPKDAEFKEYCAPKRKFKDAYYIDMNKEEDKKINSLFEENIVTNKTLVIADHVKKIDYIFSKQKLYGFSLLFITSSKLQVNGGVYYISKFERENIPTLQENIKQNYNNIEILSKQEIDALYDLTFGNIGKIHFLLERQEYVVWIKQLALHLQTEYDKELNAIQIKLFKGEYSLAKTELIDFEYHHNIEIQNNNDLYFKYYLMRSDCEHLLNNYQNALDILTALRRKELQNYNIHDKMEILEAHYYKHLWQCDKALIILHSIRSTNICGLTDALGILVAKYFVDDMKVPNSKLDSLSEFFEVFEACKSSSLKKSDNDTFKIMRNESIYLFYKKQCTRDKILQPINSVIEKYQEQNNRLLCNAYFVRAEINRLFQEYQETLLDYNRCLANTEDENIKIQVNIMKYYLSNIKNLNIFKSDQHLSKDEIIDLCKNKNQYGMLLVRRLNSIELEDLNKDNIVDCIEHRIMTIL